jgi:hypothetical protein
VSRQSRAGLGRAPRVVKLLPQAFEALSGLARDDLLQCACHVTSWREAILENVKQARGMYLYQYNVTFNIILYLHQYSYRMRRSPRARRPDNRPRRSSKFFRYARHLCLRTAVFGRSSGARASGQSRFPTPPESAWAGTATPYRAALKHGDWRRLCLCEHTPGIPKTSPI